MTDHTLASFGWSDHFEAQLPPDSALRPARIAEIHRSHLAAIGPDGPLTLHVRESTGDYAVGDWTLHDGLRAKVRLVPKTEIVRRVAGTTSDRQLIAANVDTLGIVTSCNLDFSMGRLERYLSAAIAAGCAPLVIMTKADMSPDPQEYVRQAQSLSPLVTAIALNARDGDEALQLATWAGPGQTLALVGSSGVGKTTLQNALTGIMALTQGIREDDARGRHTTTYRSLRPTLAGGWLIDTPGIRELAPSEAATGIAATFADIAEIAARCRFNNCTHTTEPGCAVQAAIASGELDLTRLKRQQKLEREDRNNTENLHQRHARFRNFAKAKKAGKARADHKRQIPDDD